MPISYPDANNASVPDGEKKWRTKEACDAMGSIAFGTSSTYTTASFSPATGHVTRTWSEYLEEAMDEAMAKDEGDAPDSLATTSSA